MGNPAIKAADPGHTLGATSHHLAQLGASGNALGCTRHVLPAPAPPPHIPAPPRKAGVFLLTTGRHRTHLFWGPLYLYVAAENIYRDRSEDSAPLGDIFSYLRNLTLPAHGPARRFSFDMVGTRGSLVGPEGWGRRALLSASSSPELLRTIWHSLEHLEMHVQNGPKWQP